MNRRQFLTITTISAMTGVVGLGRPYLVTAKGITPITRRKLYQGTKDGKLFESLDGGKTWQLVANFGAHCSVDSVVTQQDGMVMAKLACTGYTFELQSSDARLWRTR